MRNNTKQWKREACLHENAEVTKPHTVQFSATKKFKINNKKLTESQKQKSYAHQCSNDEIKQNNAFKNLVNMKESKQFGKCRQLWRNAALCHDLPPQVKFPGDQETSENHGNKVTLH